MSVNNNGTTRILIVIIAGLVILTLFSGGIYIFSVENKVKQQLNKQQESQNLAVSNQIQDDEKSKVEIQQKRNLNTNQKMNNNREIGNVPQITQEEGAYIRTNFNTFFGENQVCHNIGRNHVNFPEVYNGNRKDISQALYNLIKKTDSSFNGYSENTEEEVMKWYNANCVTYNEAGAENSNTLKYFYEYASNF